MKQVLITVIALLIGTFSFAQKTISNPLLPSGADPWSIYKNGFYYYTNTVGDRLIIWKTKNLADLKTAEKKTIFMPPAGTLYSKELWAPEIHFINGKWYVYFAADDGNNNHHRMYVLENASADPLQGEWTFKGKVSDPADKWAIDGSVFEYKGTLYMIWSGWEHDTNGRQDLYIARMKNPWTIYGNRVRISSPFYAWEKDGDTHNPNDVAHVDVNEGPQSLIHNDKLFIIYSASGCWTDSYSLGMLTFTGTDNLLDSAAWKKNPTPVMAKSEKNGVYAPGHNSFFTSPDGKENWILYHANARPGQGCGGFRSPRAQPFTWRADGTPDFGEPVPTRIALPAPAESMAQASLIEWGPTVMIRNVPLFTDKGPVTEVNGNVQRSHGKFGSQYCRMLHLGKASWLAAYTVSNNDGYKKDKEGGLQLEVARSDDGGQHWKILGLIKDPGRDLDNAQMIRLKDGRILLGCRSVRWQESYRLPVYQSKDLGKTWTILSTIDSNEGAPGTLGNPDQGLYEPHFLFLNDGRLSVMYASEKYAKGEPAFNQIIAQKISVDNGRSWGNEINVAADTAHLPSRPGMPVWTKMKNGGYIVVYEICGPEKCAVYYKKSPDGINWPYGLGEPVPDQLAAPYILSLSDGRLVLTSNKSTVSVSTDYGNTWQLQSNAWPQTLWPALYETGPNTIIAVNGVHRKEGGHSIQGRFGTVR